MMDKEIRDLLERVLGKINIHEIDSVTITWRDNEGLNIEVNVRR